MIKSKILILTFLACLFLSGHSQNRKIKVDLVQIFWDIPSKAKVVEYKNALKINNKGGHLQGVQMTLVNGEEVAYISGSSNNEAYLVEVHLGKKEVTRVYDLMYKPYKHAGGIQVYDDKLVVGIEDNSEKDKSRVCAYSLDKEKGFDTNPLYQIQRQGEPMRSTAGCVGIASWKGEEVVVVGDWDTKHLDVYVIENNEVSENPHYKITVAELDRSNWVDRNWYSYQNINLLNFNGQLYLVGMGQDQKGRDIADLYSFQPEKGNTALKKLASKSFNCTRGVNFRAGAGIMLFPDNTLGIISCGGHVDKSSYLNIFR